MYAMRCRVLVKMFKYLVKLYRNEGEKIKTTGNKNESQGHSVHNCRYVYIRQNITATTNIVCHLSRAEKGIQMIPFLIKFCNKVRRSAINEALSVQSVCIVIEVLHF